MPSLATSLADYIAFSLADGLGNPALIRFANATFTNASSRTPIDTMNAAVLADVAGGTLATTTYDDGSGKGALTYAMLQSARENLWQRNREMDHAAWTPDEIQSRSATTDPQGNSTANRIIPSTNSTVHYVYQPTTPDGSSVYSFQCLMKEAGYDYTWLNPQAEGYNGTPGTNTTIADIATPSIDVIGGDAITATLQAFGTWEQLQLSVLSDAAAASNSSFSIMDDVDTGAYAGDGSSGTDYWMPVCEAGPYASSPIHTPASASVVRAKDQLYWTAAQVPASILSGTWCVKIAPFWAHSDDASNRYICAIGANDYLRWNGTNDKFEIYDASAQKVTSGALTFARNTLMTLTINAAAGTLQVENADTGDSTETGTAWAWPSGTDMDWGQDSTDGSQIDGWISEPFLL